MQGERWRVMKPHCLAREMRQRALDAHIRATKNTSHQEELAALSSYLEIAKLDVANMTNLGVQGAAIRQESVGADAKGKPAWLWAG